MPAHETPLIATIASASSWRSSSVSQRNRLRISPLVGYLLAGIAGRSLHAGLRGRSGAGHELAEIGVILLMFGVGLHFSLKDLMSVRAIAVPGAIVQIAVATLLGMALARAWAGRPAPGWCSAWPCRSPAPSSCSERCRSAACWRPSAAASRSAG